MSSSSSGTSEGAACGIPETRTWKPKDDGCVTNDDDNDNNDVKCQDREYVIYRPTILCDESSSSSATNEDDNIVLPIVFAIHCYGCSQGTMMHWTEIAETYHFVLIIPIGINKSFNAGVCCGYALEQDIDDVGFLRGIMLHEIMTSPMFNTAAAFSETAIATATAPIYAMGWSNGGYLSVYASSLFRAIAPISGYQVDLDTIKSIGSSEVTQQQQQQQEKSIFFHHAKDDTFVQPTGCCTDSSMPKCCCSLDTFHDTCISVQDYWQEWTTKKTMTSDCTNNDDHDIAAVTTVQTTISNENVTCQTVVLSSGNNNNNNNNNNRCRNDNGRYVNSTICIHEKGRHFNHPSFATAFSMKNEIAIFFARDACLIGEGNTWSDETETCTCAAVMETTTIASDDETLSSSSSSSSQGGVPKQPYCLGGSSFSSLSSVSSSTSPPATTTTTTLAPAAASAGAPPPPTFVPEVEETTSKTVLTQEDGSLSEVAVDLTSYSNHILVGLLVVLAISFATYKFVVRRRRRRQKYSGFEQVSTVELGTMGGGGRGN